MHLRLPGATMPHMAKKKPTPEGAPIPSSDEAARGDRSKDRHRPRRTVSVSPELYQALQALADQNGRPLSWEVRRILTEHLKAAGLWPLPEGA